MSLNGFDLLPGDIVKLWDEDYVGARGAGRIVSVVGTAVTLDRPVTLVGGSKIDVLLADGTTIEQRNIVETAGTTSTFTVASAFSQAVLPTADYVLTLAATARQFKVMALSQDEPNTVGIEAVFHDPSKFSRVESNISTPAAVFSTVRPSITNAPTGLTFREVQVNNANEGTGGLRRTLLVSWIAPTQGQVKNYIMRYRLGAGEWQKAEPDSANFEITPAFAGTYEFDVAGFSTFGLKGPSVTGSYTIQTTGGGASTLNAPTSLQVLGGGSTFTGLDLNLQWTNPSSNSSVLSATLRDFEVRFIETTGSTTVRTVYAPAVAAGAVQTLSYTYSMNVADGGPRRTVQVQVRCRDAANNLSNPVTVTFSNPAPAVLAGVSVVGGIGNIKLSYTKPTDSDFAGVLLWRSTTSGFTPGAGNLLYETGDNYISDQVDFGTTYYYRLAAFDTFSKPLNGAGLNISTQVSGAALAGEGIPEVASLPTPAGYTGPKIVYLNTDGKLYSYVSGAWQVTIPEVSGVADGSITLAKLATGLRPVEVVGALPSSGNTEGRMVYLTGDDKLYRYNGAAWITSVAAADVTGTLTNTQIADLAAAKLTGQVTSTQITDSSISTTKLAAGAVTTAKIAADAVTANEIAANAITAAELAAGAVTTAKLAAGAVTANELAANSVVAGKIQAGAIGANEIAAGAIRTDKLLVTSRGQALNDDPAIEDPSAWVLLGTGTSIASGTTAANAVGSTYFSNSTGASNARVWSRPVVIDPAKTYSLTANLYAQAGNDRNMYIFVDMYDVNGAQVTTAGWGGSLSGYVYGGTPTVNQFSRQGGQFGAGVPGRPIPANVRTIKVGVWFQYSGAGSTSAVQAAQDIRLERVNDGSLIVDGAITASKIAANTITSSELASNSVTAGQIAASSVDASKIVAGSITGDRLTANTITGDKIAAGTVTANKIDTRGLDIKDAGGNVIFSSGVPLTATYISPSSSWLNSNVSIGPNGALSGAGGGQVTIAGLGYTGSLNASSDITLVPHANCTVAGNTVTKVASGGNWDGGVYSRESFVGGAYASAQFSGGTAMIGLNADPTADASYTSLDYALYWTGDGRVFVYESGGQIAQVCGVGEGLTTDVFSIVYDGRSVKYLRNGVVLHQKGVTITQNLYFDCSLYSVGECLRNVKFGPVQSVTNSNHIDPKTWVYGSTGSQLGFNQNATTAGGLNYITEGAIPNGDTSFIWRARSGTGASAEGGWNGTEFPVDPTKMYRFSVWIKPYTSAGPMSGSFYLGCGVVNNLAAGQNTNAYFVGNNRSTLENGQWYLVVGYVYPAAYAGSANIGGVYKAANGQKVQGTTSYRWESTTRTSYHRSYQYYSNTNNDYQDFWAPRVDICDGTEPTVDEMLAVGAVSGRNVITAGTASTYIASAAINLAQINTASIGSLSAITATIGTLRTATSGARTEIADNVIRVYDSSNVLRVKIGNLS